MTEFKYIHRVRRGLLTTVSIGAGITMARGLGLIWDWIGGGVIGTAAALFALYEIYTALTRTWTLLQGNGSFEVKDGVVWVTMNHKNPVPLKDVTEIYLSSPDTGKQLIRFPKLLQWEAHYDNGKKTLLILIPVGSKELFQESAGYKLAQAVVETNPELKLVQPRKRNKPVYWFSRNGKKQ